MQLTEILKLLKDGYRIRHETWPSDHYVEMSMQLIDQDGLDFDIIINSPHDFDGWELYLPDGWYTLDGKDYLKYEDWNLWDSVEQTWVQCRAPENPWLKQEGRFHPGNYNIESKLVDNIPF